MDCVAGSLPRVPWNMGTTFWWERVFWAAPTERLSALKAEAAAGQAADGMPGLRKRCFAQRNAVRRMATLSMALNAVRRKSLSIQRCCRCNPGSTMPSAARRTRCAAPVAGCWGSLCRQLVPTAARACVMVFVLQHQSGAGRTGKQCC